MRPRIRFADAPYRPRRLDALLEPLLYAANLGVAALLFPAWRTARVQWSPPAASLIRLFRQRSRPIICFAWHEYELVGACAFRDFPRDLVPLAIGHDGLMSRALQQSAVWYGIPVWAYRRRSKTSPRTQIVSLLKAERPVAFLFPDSGGPERQIRPGLLEAARAAGALLVPMAWHARPVVAARLPRRYLIPVPYSEITAYYGEALDASDATGDACRQALEGLERRMST